MNLPLDHSLPDQVGCPHPQELPLSAAALLDLMSTVLERGASFRFCARGSSMHPWIRHGDRIEIAPRKSGRVQLGDVVAYHPPGTRQLVVHRVVKQAGPLCWIQADNSDAAPDGPVGLESILGLVVRVERQGKPVSFGSGVERYMIALLSRYAMLLPLVRFAAPLYRLLVKRKSG